MNQHKELFRSLLEKEIRALAHRIDIEERAQDLESPFEPEPGYLDNLRSELAECQTALASITLAVAA